MGTLYFILKNSIITIVVVCLLQLKFGNKTMEERLMDFVKSTVAPKFLGKETLYIEKKSLKFSPKDLNSLRKKVYNHPVFQNVQNSAKELFLKEMTDVIQDSQEKKLKELEKLSEEDSK